MTTGQHAPDPDALAADIRRWGEALGFQQVGFSDVDLAEAGSRLEEWLLAGYHGEMAYMSRHGVKRIRPELLVPGTLTVISVRMDYLPDESVSPTTLLDDGRTAYVSRYALGRDYHKTLRGRLRQLGRRIEAEIGPFGHRVFVDSAPVLEKPLAARAGLGWIGKHSNLINREAGSWFFLGELFVDFPLPPDAPASRHCGTCRACIDICPTQAIVAPFVVDARRCISYLTIELDGDIPEEFREAIGNRIYGCDDCQLYCPWNKFAKPSAESDFAPRHGLERTDLVSLFAWSRAQWMERTEGSAIRRIGYERWLRNIAVALGNAAPSREVTEALERRRNDDSEMVRNHVEWALDRQAARRAAAND